MRIKILWPGKTRNAAIKQLQEDYLQRINQLERCELIETREAKGIPEKQESRIKEIESEGLEKHFKNDYIICLFDQGKVMNSQEFAQFLEKAAENSTRAVTFVVGGFLGLAERVISRADFLLSLSKMTFTHELSRVMLLEQLYRSLSITKGRQYAK